ncbi:Programmed cell death protein 5 [Pseudolycoriella hygida]|uniref:Programmed cell death protein 5 n=1 Tax=Pseudolycoriella hygida TaxID=35572 RepID=A0A9Q0S0Y9_9DIPT|nr:Programmed cell death protein 5 [Pseudolycoriella hygida]
MSDADLERIRQQRMAQMQSQYAGGGDAEKQKAEEERKQQDVMNSMLAQLLDQNARARLNTLKISKPEKAQMVEGMIVRMARSGQFPGKLDDEQLIKLLEGLNKRLPKSNSTVKFDRRRAAMDSSDEEDYGF